MSQNKRPATEMAITEFITFPVKYNLVYDSIQDARNREVAKVKTLQTSDERKMRIGDWIADAMNAAAE